MAKISLFNRPFEIKRIPSFQSIALFTFVGLYGPIIILITYSFNSSASLGVFESFSFQWYVTAWENEKVQEAAFRSLYLAATAATIATIAATMAALATTRTRKFRGMTLIFYNHKSTTYDTRNCDCCCVARFFCDDKNRYWVYRHDVLNHSAYRFLYTFRISSN